MEINKTKLERLAKISLGKEKGIFLLIDEIWDEIEKLKNGDFSKLKYLKGDKGENYVLTPKDKKDIASSIKVPVVEKVIEKTEVIKEQPVIKNEIVKEIVEVAKYEEAKEIASKLNNEKEILSIETIKDLRKQLDELEAKLFIVANQPSGSVMPSGGSMGVYLLDEGVKVNQNPIQKINFAGGGITTTYVGQDTAVVTISASAPTTETPTGTIDGVNTIYTTTSDITTIYSFAINGMFIHPDEYSVSGNTITFVSPLPADLSGTNFTIIYA